MQRHFIENLVHMRRVYIQYMEPVCWEWHLTVNEAEILMFLLKYPEQNRAADIVAYHNLTKSHVSLSVKHLVKRGLLTSSPDPDDRRTARLRLTPEALPAAQDALYAHRNFTDDFLKGITEQDLEAYWHISDRINCNLSQMENRYKRLTTQN